MRSAEEELDITSEKNQGGGGEPPHADRERILLRAAESHTLDDRRSLLEALLKENADLDTVISVLKSWCQEDPSSKPLITLWNVAGSQFFLRGDYASTEKLYQSLYKWLLDLQNEHSRRYSKSIPLYHLGLRYWASEFYPEALGFFALGYIEEVLDGVDLKEAQSRSALAGPFLVSGSVLDDLGAYISSPKAPADKSIPEGMFQAYLKEKPRVSSAFCRAPWDTKKSKCPRCGERLKEGVLTPRIRVEELDQSDTSALYFVNAAQVVLVEKTADYLKALDGSLEDAGKLPALRLMALTCPMCLRVEVYLAPPRLVFKRA